MSVLYVLLAAFATGAVAQSVEGLGSSGGSGPRGGLGDKAHPVRHAQAFITDGYIPPIGQTARQLELGAAPILLANADASTTCGPIRQVVVDSTSHGRRQEMVGFGHSWTDSTVSVFNTLEPALYDQVMDDLFGQDGNNMGFMRHTMGSSDLSGNQYSYDDNGPSFNEGEPDPTLSHFGLGTDGTAMAEMIATMGQYKSDVFLFGSPWSYPGWMKNNDLFIEGVLNYNGQQYVYFNNSFNIEYIPQAVEYFTKYVDAYKSHGVTINGITLENEPLNYQGGYPCMYLDAADEAQILIQGLGKEMQSRGVAVLAYDHNTDQPVYPARVIEGAGKLVDGIAWHCYQSPFADYSVLEDLHRAYPDKVQFMTECSSYLPTPGTTSFQVAANFIPPVQHGASGAAMWVMATDQNYGPHSPYGGCAGCEGSIIVNSTASYTKTHDYYMIGQFSRFIRRGATNYQVIFGSQGDAWPNYGGQFWAIALKNPDDSWAIVFMNNLQSDEDVVLSFTGEGEAWEGTVPRQSVVTWVLPSAQILSQTNGTHTNGTYSSSATVAPPFPFGNATTTLHNGTFSFSPISASGTGSTNATTSVCTFVSATTSTSTTTQQSSMTVLPVPNTTHTIATSA